MTLVALVSALEDIAGREKSLPEDDKLGHRNGQDHWGCISMLGLLQMLGQVGQSLRLCWSSHGEALGSLLPVSIAPSISSVITITFS